MNVKKLTQLAMLTGIALIIFVVEMQIPNPFPLPGVKLGLANIITVYAIYHYRAREVIMIVLVRLLLASIFGGNMMAFLYSLAGSAICLAGMLLLKRVIDEKYIWISSVFGAVLHNIGQILVAVLILGTSVLVYFPFLLVSGCLAGAFTGICAQFVIHRLDIIGDK
ncbi:MAG: Gx transporter family protein [Ruminococcus sp.]|nr:Gx transporter family protein [Ruminococcus sp.]